MGKGPIGKAWYLSLSLECLKASMLWFNGGGVNILHGPWKRKSREKYFKNKEKLKEFLKDKCWEKGGPNDKRIVGTFWK